MSNLVFSLASSMFSLFNCVEYSNSFKILLYLIASVRADVLVSGSEEQPVFLQSMECYAVLELPV